MGRNFKKLKIYDLSYRFVLEVYGVLPSFPETELRNMYSQLQRAATSIVLNIVEGASNRSNKVFFNHLQYSYGSCREVEVLLLLAKDLHFIENDVYTLLEKQLEELKATLYRFMESVDREVQCRKDNWNFRQ
ncbi:MAG: four helix bundle protein [Candidatus Woesearchaeota archaeon]